MAVDQLLRPAVVQRSVRFLWSPPVQLASSPLGVIRKIPPMSPESGPQRDTAEEIGLIVQQEGTPQQALVKYLTLMLSSRYGFNVVMVRSVSEASAALMQRGAQVRCVFVVQAQDITHTTMAALSQRGKVPLFLLLPKSAAATPRETAF